MQRLTSNIRCRYDKVGKYIKTFSEQLAGHHVFNHAIPYTINNVSYAMDERRMTAQFAFPKQQELVDYDLKVKRQTALRFAIVP